MLEKISDLLSRLSKQQKLLFAFAIFLITVLIAQTWFINYNKQNSEIQNITVNRTSTTDGPTQTFLPDTQPSGAAEREDNFQKENHPDVFLSNQTPFENEMFLVESGYKSAPTGHFYFKIMLKGNYETSKKTVFDWMKSLGLLDTQIQKLDIEYISI